MIISTHDLHRVQELCSRTAVLDGGKLAAFGPTSILSDNALFNEHGLELLYDPIPISFCP